MLKNMVEFSWHFFGVKKMMRSEQDFLPILTGAEYQNRIVEDINAIFHQFSRLWLYVYFPYDNLIVEYFELMPGKLHHNPRDVLPLRNIEGTWHDFPSLFFTRSLWGIAKIFYLYFTYNPSRILPKLRSVQQDFKTLSSISWAPTRPSIEGNVLVIQNYPECLFDCVSLLHHYEREPQQDGHTENGCHRISDALACNFWDRSAYGFMQISARWRKSPSARPY